MRYYIQITITIFFIFLTLFVQNSSADIIYFEDGRIFEGNSTTVENGILVDGVFFSNSEVKDVKKGNISKKSTKQNKNVKKDPWYKRIVPQKKSNSTQTQKNKERTLSEYNERLKKTRTTLYSPKKKVKKKATSSYKKSPPSTKKYPAKPYSNSKGSNKKGS